jgi:hypothetical protein
MYKATGPNYYTYTRWAASYLISSKSVILCEMLCSPVLSLLLLCLYSTAPSLSLCSRWRVDLILNHREEGLLRLWYHSRNIHSLLARPFYTLIKEDRLTKWACFERGSLVHDSDAWKERAGSRAHTSKVPTGAALEGKISLLPLELSLKSSLAWT